MKEWIDLYLRDAKEEGYAEGSIYHKRIAMMQFLRWCTSRSLERVQEISEEDIDRYRKHLYYNRDKSGKGLSFKSQQKKLREVSRFFEYLKKIKEIEKNPAREIEGPRECSTLPVWLNHEEMKKILEMPDIRTDAGIRDRSLLELLYAIGLRREETGSLKISDIDFEDGSINVLKERQVRKLPLLKRTLYWLKRYMEYTRPNLLKGKEYEDLFLTQRGEPYICRNLSMVVERYKNKAGIQKKGDFVLFKHSVIILLLEGGMDARYIQEMMGLKKLEQVQGYSAMNLRKLKEVHEQTHPGNK